jgi:hypothetical protein
MSEEIVGHMQSTGTTLGNHKPAIKLDGLLSYGTYNSLFGWLLRKEFVAAVTEGSLTIDVNSNGTMYDLVRSAGNFQTGNIFKVGMVVRMTGGGVGFAANINKNLVIVNIVGDTMTVSTLGSVTLTDLTSDGTVTITQTGVYTYSPDSGHTNKYFTLEEYFSDLTKNELYTDCKVNTATINVPSTGNATISFDIVSLKRTLGSASTLTDSGGDTTTTVMGAVTGAIFANGTKLDNVTSASITITSNITQESVIGTNYSPDHNLGKISVSGTFTAMFDSTTIQTIYDNETNIAFILILADDGTATANVMSFIIPKITITDDAPDDGEKVIIRTYPFVAEFNGDGGNNTGEFKTIIALQM